MDSSIISHERRGLQGCGAIRSHAHTQRIPGCPSQVCTVTDISCANGGVISRHRSKSPTLSYTVGSQTNKTIPGAGRSSGDVKSSNVKRVGSTADLPKGKTILEAGRSSSATLASNVTNVRCIASKQKQQQRFIKPHMVHAASEASPRGFTIEQMLQKSSAYNI